MIVLLLLMYLLYIYKHERSTWIFDNKTTDTNSSLTMFYQSRRKSCLPDFYYSLIFPFTTRGREKEELVLEMYFVRIDRSDSGPSTLWSCTVTDVAGVLGGLHLLQHHVTAVLTQSVHLQQETNWRRHLLFGKVWQFCDNLQPISLLKVFSLLWHIRLRSSVLDIT